MNLRTRRQIGVVAMATATSLWFGGSARANENGGAVVVLDPTSDCSLDLSGAMTFTITGGRRHVNSSSACAMCNNGTPTLIVPLVSVVGGSCLESEVYSGPLNSSAPARPDPLVHVPAPPNGPTRVSPPPTGAQSILPGYYPNGIRKNSGSLNMAPGIYVVEGTATTGGFQITSGDVTGFGVMVYIKSGPLELGGNGNITLTPPNPIDYAFQGADTYESVTIFQARTNTTESQIISTNIVNVEGSLYFPNNAFSLGGTGDGIGNQIIAWQFHVFGNGSLTLNYTGIHPGSLCQADVNRTFTVDIDDLLEVINSWGLCKSSPCAGDVFGDGIVNIEDLLAVINAWGACP